MGSAQWSTEGRFASFDMELPSIQDLVKRRKKLVKMLRPLQPTPIWPEDIEAHCHRLIEREIIEIDQQIAERTGSSQISETE